MGSKVRPPLLSLTGRTRYRPRSIPTVACACNDDKVIFASVGFDDPDDQPSSVHRRRGEFHSPTAENEDAACRLPFYEVYPSLCVTQNGTRSRL